MGRGKGWTTEEDWDIKDMFEQGMGSLAISTKLGRSESGVRRRIEALGLKSTPEPIQANERFEEVLSSIDAGKVLESQPSEIQESDEPTKKAGQKGKGRYKIRFLVDGLEERTATLVANNEKHAMTGLIKKLNQKDGERTYDIIRVENFEPMDEENIDSVDAGKKKEEKNIHDLAKEFTEELAPKAIEIANGLTDAWDQIVNNMKEAVMEEPVCKDGVCEIVQIPKEEEGKAVIDEARMKMIASDVFTERKLGSIEAGPVAVFGSNGTLEVMGVVLQRNEAVELVEFCKRIAPLMEVM